MQYLKAHALSKIVKPNQAILRCKELVKIVVHYSYLLYAITKFHFYFFIKKVEYYQPLYNFFIFRNITPQRFCKDRADAVYSKISSWGPGARILDIGCSLGYFSHYFSERKYQVHGIDSSADNVAICNMLRKINRNHAQFSVDTFSKEFIEQIPYLKYDITFLFSVVHHIIYYKGLEYAQDLMVQLLERIPVLFVELAVRHFEAEVKPPEWAEHIPFDELDVFAKCKNISIEKIGYFPTHLGSFLRPIYMIKANRIQLCGTDHPLHGSRFISYYQGKHNGCTYYDCGDVFIKRYSITSYPARLTNVLKEIENHQKLAVNDYFPRLLFYEKQDNVLTLKYNKISGSNLRDLIISGQPVEPLPIFIDVMRALDFLFQHGLYHNDVRMWNIISDGKKARLLDLEFADCEEKDHTNIALLWIVAQLHRFRPRMFPHPVTTPPDFEYIKLQAEFKPIIRALETKSFPQFLEWFRSYF